MNILAFDIGGTYIKYALMDEQYNFLDRDRIPTPLSGREELISTLAFVYRKYKDVQGITISMPGIIDVKNGLCKMGGALRYNDNFYLRDALRKECPVRIVLENDAKCAAMAEASAGSLKDVEDGFVLIFGTMIGGGYIKNHQLVRGRHFSAGEVSYITTIRDEKPTAGNIFGNRCGTPSLCTMYAEKKGLDKKEVSGVTVFKQVNDGDPEALEVLDRYTFEIALQIFNLQTVLDVDRFAIGGGISAQPIFTQYIRKNLKALYEACPYSVSQTEVVTCMFQNDANLIGALSCWLNEE